MSPNAIIYNMLEPHDADILLFARHSIRLLLVPSQYEPVCQGGQTSPEFNMSPRGPQLTLGINAKGNASIAATMRSLARTSILQ
mgnify:CR=1 FL=1